MIPLRDRVVRLFATTGLLRVVVCPLCAGLVAAVGQSQHAAVHAAEWRTGDRPTDGGGR